MAVGVVEGCSQSMQCLLCALVPSLMGIPQEFRPKRRVIRHEEAALEQQHVIYQCPTGRGGTSCELGTDGLRLAIGLQLCLQGIIHSEDGCRDGPNCRAVLVTASSTSATVFSFPGRYSTVMS